MLTLAIADLYIPDRALALPSKFVKLLCPSPGSYPSNGKISNVLCLGNITQSLETLDFLYQLLPEFHLVQGEMDDALLMAQQLALLNGKPASTVPLSDIISHDNLRIGFTNGYQITPRNDPLSLLTIAREMDVDVLIWGGTNKVEAYTLDGKFFINPGSATGAFNTDWQEVLPEEVIEDNKEEEANPETKQDAEGNSRETDSGKNIEKTTSETTTDDEFVPSFCLLDTHDNSCNLYIYTYLENEVKVDKVSYTKE